MVVEPTPLKNMTSSVGMINYSDPWCCYINVLHGSHQQKPQSCYHFSTSTMDPLGYMVICLLKPPFSHGFPIYLLYNNHIFAYQNLHIFLWISYGFPMKTAIFVHQNSITSPPSDARRLRLLNSP